MISIVTVYHTDAYQRMAFQMANTLAMIDSRVKICMVNNGPAYLKSFSKACNEGSRQVDPMTTILGFLNPDAQILDSFSPLVYRAFEDRKVVIYGNRYRKPQIELRQWGVRHWVCGACLFVLRSWFDEVGGFDEQFVWSFEETDLIRRAELAGRLVVELDLPIRHDSPSLMGRHEVEYKSRWLQIGWQRYKAKHKL